MRIIDADNILVDWDTSVQLIFRGKKDAALLP